MFTAVEIREVSQPQEEISDKNENVSTSTRTLPAMSFTEYVMGDSGSAACPADNGGGTWNSVSHSRIE